jgi:hypothetical protein
MKNLKDLTEKFPNDMDLGKAVRRLINNSEDPIELLKEVIALHGFGGYGYANHLLERGKAHYWDEDGNPIVYRHSIDSFEMDRVDNKIIDFLKKLDK